MDITQAELKDRLHYNLLSGQWTWKINRKRALAGNKAGTINGSGYAAIVIEGIQDKILNIY